MNLIKRSQTGLYRFETTQWTIVMSASSDSEESREALEQLYVKYWHPLYAYIRSKGYNVEDAEDLIQSFFAKLIEKKYLKIVSRERGRFRTFLLTSMKRFMSNDWHRRHARKRKEAYPHLSLDFEAAEIRFQTVSSSNLTPDIIYQRQWAISLINEVMKDMQAEAAEKGKEKVFSHLREFISGGPSGIPYHRVAEEIGMNEGAIKVAVHRLRKRFGERLRDKIAQTVRSPEEVEEEIHSLFMIFG